MAFFIIWYNFFMDYFTIFSILAVISFFATASPGPDFIVVSKNSIFGSRKIGFFTAVGVGTGILTHVFYSVLGVGFIISQSIILFNIIKYLGALYLLYLAYQLLKSKKQKEEKTKEQKIRISNKQAFLEGFFTNSLNPKATLFFLSIFTQIVTPEIPFLMQTIFGFEIAFIVLIYFVILSFILTNAKVSKLFKKFHFYLMKIFGGILAFLGLKILVSED